MNGKSCGRLQPDYKAQSGDRARHNFMACSALPSEIAQNDLTHCYYLAVHCRTHGEIRVATAEPPADECYPCPLCQAICYSTLLGEGGTLRELPFWNRIQDAYSFAQADRKLWLDRKASRTQA